jgi:hypothetical protein
MDLYNIKTKNKKGMFFMTFFVYVIGIFLIAVIFIIISGLVSSTKQELEYSEPILHYQFPITFVQAFLYAELTPQQKKELGIDKNTPYYVKDLLSESNFGSDQEKIYEQIKQDFVTKHNSSLDSFKQHANLNFYMPENYYLYVYDTLERDDFQMKCLLDTYNYGLFFPIQSTSQSKYKAIIFYKFPSCKTVASEKFKDNLNNGGLRNLN